MLETNKGLESPTYISDNSASKQMYARDLYNSESDGKYGSPDSNLRYDRIKNSETEISTHIDKVSQFQNERLAEELKSNAFYKRELENLRSNLSNTRNKVKSNHFADEDYLLRSTKERIKHLQHEREKEIAQRLTDEKNSARSYTESDSAEKVKVRVKQNQRESELYKELYSKGDEGLVSDRLRDSIGSNKTYELSQSAKSPSADYKEKISGGLKALEEKMNRMERELDDHLIQNNQKYFTNKELVRQKQIERERELLKEKELDEEIEGTEEDEEEQRLGSMQEKQKKFTVTSPQREKRDVKFKNAFSKREEKLKQEEEEVEKETNRKNKIYVEQSPSPDKFEETEGHRRRVFEEELELLKEENRRIKQELHGIQKDREEERRYDEPKFHPADLITRQNLSQMATIKKATIARESNIYESDQAFGKLKKEDKIQQTIKAAKKRVQDNLKGNRTAGSKSLNRKSATASEKKPEFLGLRNELYKKYYGYPVHLKEATYLLNKGIPTTFMSDSRPEVVYRDPKKTLPKRYEKALKS